MKKILPILVVVILIGLGAYFLLGKGGLPVGPAGLKKSDIFTGGLKMAVEKGIPLKCDWKKDESNFGTSWVKGEKIYSEMTMEGKLAYMLMKDNCVWSWDKEGQGTKFCFEEVDYDEIDKSGMGDLSVPEEPQTGETEAPEYTCAPAAISDSKFELPTNVNFINPQEMMQMGE